MKERTTGRERRRRRKIRKNHEYMMIIMQLRNLIHTLRKLLRRRVVQPRSNSSKQEAHKKL